MYRCFCHFQPLVDNGLYHIFLFLSLRWDAHFVLESMQERKVLVKGGFRDRHFNWGSILLGTGVLFSVSGAVNTYLRTGKLFPGPHLYAGVGTFTINLTCQRFFFFTFNCSSSHLELLKFYTASDKPIEITYRRLFVVWCLEFLIFLSHENYDLRKVTWKISSCSSLSYGPHVF